MRNNSGVLKNPYGRPVRFGLGNDSEAVNRKFKSADLVGIRQVLITPEMVGTVIGQFMGIETKTAEFRGPAGDPRAEAQDRWNKLIHTWGGIAGFAGTVDQARLIWEG